MLAVDLPGFGHSPPLPAGQPCTPEALADAVEAAMDAAGFETAHLAGNSLGGWIALTLARRGRARTVTAISPAGLAHARERELGKGVLLGMRWLARNAPAPEGLLRSPRRPDPASPGPRWASPGACDPDDLIEQTRAVRRRARASIPRSSTRSMPRWRASTRSAAPCSCCGAPRT